MHSRLTLNRPLDGLRANATGLIGRVRPLCRAHPAELVAATVGSALVLTAIAVSLSQPSLPVQVTRSLLPAIPTMNVRPIAPDQAILVNAAIPVAVGPNPVAVPFLFKGTPAARDQAISCLASAAFYEAGNQSEDGERAVAQVVLNRVRHPAFPGSVCGVVYEGSTRPTGCQFTFACDGSLQHQPNPEGWRRATQVAEAALDGYVDVRVGWATHYHADYVVPYWAASMAKNAAIGPHLFYRWAGNWGRPAIFSKTYAGREPSASALRLAALAVPHIIPVYARSQVEEAVARIPGAEPIKLAPSQRGDKRIAVRFNLASRKASNEATHVDYTKRFEATDNLKWSLSNDPVADNQRPLGSHKESIEAGGSSAQD